MKLSVVSYQLSAVSKDLRGENAPRAQLLGKSRIVGGRMADS
jgi:hypothetical protein